MHAYTQSSPPGGIVRIMDQYLDCISLEQTLFSLNMKDAFAGYNAPNLTEAQIRYGYGYGYWIRSMIIGMGMDMDVRTGMICL